MGTLPERLSALSKLKYLRLFENQLKGTIPASYGQLSNLEHMSLSGNSLSGSIPLIFANMTRLNFGECCDFIPGLEMMLCFYYLIHLMLFLILPLQCLKRIVKLNDNTLEGSIPKQLGNHPSLWYLYLQNNSLTGEIPDFGKTSKLENLQLQNNKLEGTIPQSLSHAPLGKYQILMVATINSYFLVSKHFLQTLSFFTTIA